MKENFVGVKTDDKTDNKKVTAVKHGNSQWFFEKVQKGLSKFMVSEKSQVYIAGLLVLGIAGLLLASHILTSRAVSGGVNAAVHSYVKSKEETRQTTYQKYVDIGFAVAEANNHVSNDVNINVADIKKTAKLEVLRVHDTEYIIENAEDNEANITSWLKVPGDGVLTVDLQASEYLVDEEQHIVVIKLPQSELTQYAIDYENIEKKLFHNQKWKDETLRESIQLAEKQLQEANARIKDEFCTNPIYVKNAKKSAEQILINWVKGLNQDISDLTVKVEFTDN